TASFVCAAPQKFRDAQRVVLGSSQVERSLLEIIRRVYIGPFQKKHAGAQLRQRERTACLPITQILVCSNHYERRGAFPAPCAAATWRADLRLAPNRAFNTNYPSPPR
ncbi:unnamed protein product, partial [Ectocarpus sp. 8 AP-2014]